MNITETTIEVWLKAALIQVSDYRLLGASCFSTAYKFTFLKDD
jgi:hypothetical protein